MLKRFIESFIIWFGNFKAFFTLRLFANVSVAVPFIPPVREHPIALLFAVLGVAILNYYDGYEAAEKAAEKAALKTAKR